MTRTRPTREHPLIGMAEALSASGMNKLLLHAWERRYGMKPAVRSPSGRRFYTRDQVERLRLLKACSDRGYRIGKLINLDTETLAQLDNDVSARNTFSEMLDAVNSLDGERLQALLMVELDRNTPEQFIQTTVMPLLSELASRIASREVPEKAERMATAQIKRILGRLFDRCPQPTLDAPGLVAATPYLVHQDLGALVITLLARLRGWNAMFLGANLPVDEIAKAARDRGVRCVCLSALTGRKVRLERDLRSLRSLIPPEIEIWISGTTYQTLSPLQGVRYLSGVHSLLASLEAGNPILWSQV